MASTPILRELHAKLVARGRTIGHPITETGEDEALYAVCSWIMEQGHTLTDLAFELKTSRGLLYTWINSRNHPERKEAYKEAQRVGAHGLVDDAQRLLDAATPASITVDRERVKLLQWRASKMNREDFGEDRAPPVQINFGDLHIEALKRTREVALPRPQPLPVEIIPATVPAHSSEEQVQDDEGTSAESERSTSEGSSGSEAGSSESAASAAGPDA